MGTRNLVKTVVIAAVIILAAVVIRIVDDGARGGADDNTAEPSAAPPAPRPCGTVLTESRSGHDLADATVAMVTAVHNAACRHDYGALIAEMDPEFGGGSPQGAIEDFREYTPEGVILDLLAATLETPALMDQGGLIYCMPNGATAEFSRGTLERPGGWSRFVLVRGNGRTTCAG